MLEVVLEQLKLEVVGQPLIRPRLWIGLVAAHDEAADLLLPVGEAVGIAQRREIGRDAVDLLGDEILVLHRDERDIDAGHATERSRPLPGADHELLAGNAALVGRDGAHAPALDVDARHSHALANGDAALARTLGERHGDVGGRGLPVGRQEGCAHHVVDLHQRPQRLRLLGRKELHLEPERRRRRRLPLDLDPALGIAGEPEPAIPLPAGREPGLRFEAIVEGDGIAEELRDVGAGAQLADEAGRMPGRPRRELAALQEQHVGEPHLAQVIGDRAADDAAADDDNLGRGRQLAHEDSMASNLAKDASKRLRFSAV